MQAFQNRTPDFIAPLLVVSSGIANLSSYFTPEYTKCMARYVHSKRTCLRILSVALSMIVVCVMIASRELEIMGF